MPSEALPGETVPGRADSGRLIVVCGAKGGVGTTTVVANLAAALPEGEVLIVPAPGESGDDVALWFAAGEHESATGLREVVTAGLPEALDLAVQPLAGRLKLARNRQGDPELGAAEFGNLLKLARERFPWVVVDAGAWRGESLPEPLVAAVTEASVSLVVVAPDPLSVRRARGLADALRMLGRPLRGVLNRADGSDGGSSLDAKQWEEALDGVEIAGSLPETREIPEAMIEGRPVVLARESSECAEEVGRIARAAAEHAPAPAAPRAAPDGASFQTRAFREIKRNLHRRFLEWAEGRREGAGFGDRSAVRGRLQALLEEERMPALTAGFRDRLLKELEDDVTGLGPLQDLVDDPDITEVMVNGPDAIYIERAGRLERVERSLAGDAELRGLIERIVAPLGRRVDEASPLVDARLSDGSRVNAIIPPLALGGPCLTIRKFARRRLGIDELVAGGSLSRGAADFLRACVAGKLNILISGGTGSGKTTLLNILAAFVGAGERIVTIEDAAELKLPQEHVVSLEARPPNLEGRGAVTIRDLVRNALRMRPDRIVVGEVRGPEALDMLQAMNTGHEGSLSTLHANSPRDALARVETMVLMAGMELPLRAIREQVAAAIDVIVQIARMRDGSRGVTQVAEMAGREGDVYRLQDIFVRRGEGVLAPAGLVPRVAEKLADRGQVLDAALFG